MKAIREEQIWNIQKNRKKQIILKKVAYLATFFIVCRAW